MTETPSPAGGADNGTVPATRAPAGGHLMNSMTHQRRRRTPICRFLRELRKADPLFWIFLILSAVFIFIAWLIP